MLLDFIRQLVDYVVIVLYDGPEHGVRKAIRNHEDSNTLTLLFSSFRAVQFFVTREMSSGLMCLP